MGDVLSQDQIDALLNMALSSDGGIDNIEVHEEEPQHTARDYDFRAPKKFTKDRMKTIDSVFDSYARLVSSYLTGLLRLYCKVSLVNVEEQHYFEFNNALPDYVVMGLSQLDFNNDECEEVPMIIQLSNNLTFLMIDRLLGGRGKFDKIDRDFTEIEVCIMEDVVLRLTKLMKDPWSSYANVTPKLTKLETNSRVVSGVNFDDVMIIASLEVEVSDSKTLISICVPALALDETMQKMSSVGVRVERKINLSREELRRDTIMTTLANSPLEVKAILGNVTLDLYDVLNLQIGDVVPLKKNIGGSFAVSVGGKPWFEGKLGVYNNNKAIRIDKMLKKPNKTSTKEFVEMFPGK